MYYQKFRNSLELEGYEFNPYNPCVTNKIIKNNQITVCFHVHDFKLSHKRPKVVGKNLMAKTVIRKHLRRRIWSNVSERRQYSQIPWHDFGLHS